MLFWFWLFVSLISLSLSTTSIIAKQGRYIEMFVRQKWTSNTSYDVDEQQLNRYSAVMMWDIRRTVVLTEEEVREERKGEEGAQK